MSFVNCCSIRLVWMHGNAGIDHNTLNIIDVKCLLMFLVNCSLIRVVGMYGMYGEVYTILPSLLRKHVYLWFPLIVYDTLSMDAW